MILSLYMHWKQRALAAEAKVAKCKCGKPPVEDG